MQAPTNETIQNLVGHPAPIFGMRLCHGREQRCAGAVDHDDHALACVLCSDWSGLIGMLFGYWLARLLKQDNNRSRTIRLETGIQNGPLAVLIVTITFKGELQQQVLLIPVL